MLKFFGKPKTPILRLQAESDLHETEKEIYFLQLSLESKRGRLSTLHEREARLRRLLGEYDVKQRVEE